MAPSMKWRNIIARALGMGMTCREIGDRIVPCLPLVVPAMKWRNRIAQGFSPGCGPHEIALKVATESQR
jgi:hypothetical protein